MQYKRLNKKVFIEAPPHFHWKISFLGRQINKAKEEVKSTKANRILSRRVYIVNGRKEWKLCSKR